MSQEILVQMSINLSVCMCLCVCVYLAERSNRQVVVVSGSFLSETGEAAALLWFPHEQGRTGGDVRERGGVELIKVSHCLNSSHARTSLRLFYCRSVIP